MLVLTRKANQSIMIGDEIVISVLAISRDKIRLGIQAPREVPVYREEVYNTLEGDTVAAPANSRESVDEALEDLETKD